MKITKSQLRKIIREEITRLVESAEVSANVGGVEYTVTVDGLDDVCIYGGGEYECGSMSPDGMLLDFHPESFPKDVLLALEKEIRLNARKMRM